MATRPFAQVYLLTAIVVGAGLWCVTAGTVAAASLAEISLPSMITFLGDGLGGLPWTILSTTAIGVLAWPAVLGYARRQSWVSQPYAGITTHTSVASACAVTHPEGNTIDYANTIFYGVAGSFLKYGYTAQELVAVVTAAATKSSVPQTTDRPPIPGYLPVYNVAPPELVTVSEIVEKYRVSRQSVFGWIRAGHVTEAGLLRYVGSGQRNISLLRRDEVEVWITTDLDNNIQIYETAPDGLATLATVEEELGINRRTIQAWIRRGHIHKRGLLRGAARRGGLILVSPHDVRRYSESRSIRQDDRTHVTEDT